MLGGGAGGAGEFFDFVAHGSPVTRVCASPDDTLIITAALDGSLSFFTVRCLVVWFNWMFDIGPAHTLYARVLQTPAYGRSSAAAGGVERPS